jgi:hypothetical protein
MHRDIEAAAQQQLPVYTLRRASTPPVDRDWDDPAWSAAEILNVAHFHPRSSKAHHPQVLARALYDDQAVYVAFLVHDRHVRSVNTAYQSTVCSDSCVEFFVQPKPQRGYFNFEVNCGGTLLLHYNEIEPGREAAPDPYNHTPLPESIGRQVQIAHTMPPVVELPVEGPVSWQVRVGIPLRVLESQVGPLGRLPGQRWRANFYKCGDSTPQPHWASWSPIGPALNFHQPDRFGQIVFG